MRYDEDGDNQVGWRGWTQRIDNFLSSYKNKTGKICSMTNKPNDDETCLFQVNYNSINFNKPI